MEIEHDLAPIIADEIPLPLPSEAPEPGSELELRMKAIEADLLRHAAGKEKFAAAAGRIIRDAVDYAIDAPTLMRYSIDELEPDEKTAIGKRIERLLRFRFKIPKGDKLDIKLAGEDVDIKTTISKNWMFSKSSWGRINLLIAYSEASAIFSVGLALIEAEHLGKDNRDQKRSMKKEFQERIFWILKDHPYPENLIARLPPAAYAEITAQSSGQQRIIALLRMVKDRAIPRHVIASLANQKDPLKRIRSNGGARTVLWNSDLLVLSGRYVADREIAAELNDVALGRDEVMSVDAAKAGATALAKYCAAHGLQVQ